MKLKLIFVMTLLLVITSCSKDNEIETPPKVITDRPAKISAAFPLLNAGLIISGNDVNYTFEYDSAGRVTKRNGFVFKGNIMYPDYFLHTSYTGITYTGNTAVMKNYNAGAPNERKLEFDNQGRVIKLIVPSVTDATKEKHITYGYNIAGKLAETLTSFPNAVYDPANPNDYILTYVDTFTYDNMGNMDKIVTKEKHNNIEVYIIKEVEFKDFDLVPNPFRKLGIFDEYFYYSLSTNNFGMLITKNYQLGNYINSYTSLWKRYYNSDWSMKLFE